jgi:hypothetical protein
VRIVWKLAGGRVESGTFVATEGPLWVVISTGRCNTLTKTQKMAWMLMNQRRRQGLYGGRESRAVGPLGKRAGALKSTERAFGEPTSSVYHQLTPHGGNETPAERINAGVASTG